MPLPRREIYRYLDECAPVAADVTMLSVADRWPREATTPIARSSATSSLPGC